MAAFQEAFAGKLGLVIGQLKCPICLEIFTDPVALVCGNTFCKECINESRVVILRDRYQSNNSGERSKFSCPVCRLELGPRASIYPNPQLKELSELARRTVKQWESFTGYPYQAPKVNVPLSQSAVTLNSPLRSANCLEEDPHEMPLNENLTNKIPHCQQETLGELLSAKDSEPVNISASRISRTVEFSKPPDDDPYTFHGSQSQTESKRAKSFPENEKHVVSVNMKKPADRTSSSPPKLKAKRARKGDRQTKAKVDVLSSQNSDIQRMREVIRAAEEVELIVEDRPLQSDHVPLKRQLPVEKIDDPRKKTKLSQFREIVRGSNVVDAEMPLAIHSPQKAFTEPVDAIIQHSLSERKQPAIIIANDNLEAPVSAASSTGNIVEMETHQDGIPAQVVMQTDSSNPKRKASTTHTKDASTETPDASGFILIYPDGKTVMVAINRYLTHKMVQTEVGTALVGSSQPRTFTECGVQTEDSSVHTTELEVQTDRLASAEIEIQTDPLASVEIEVQTDRLACAEIEVQTDPVTSVAAEVQTEDMVGADNEAVSMEICTAESMPGLLDANDDASTFWSLPQDNGREVRSQKSAATSSIPMLCPESLANVAAACMADEDEEDFLAETVVANSVSNSGSPTSDVVPPSPHEGSVSNQNEFVPSSVQSFLRSQDTGVTNMQLTSVFEDESLAKQATSTSDISKAVNISRITPSSAQSKASDSRPSLSNFMQRLSNQFGGDQESHQSSTPSGAALRKMTFSAEEAKFSNIPCVLPKSQAGLPQLLKECRAEPATISLTSSGCSGQQICITALEEFCNLFKCRQTQHFLIKSTTHVVLKTVPGYDGHLVCDRTMKYLLGVAARRWIISIQWVIDSVREGRILPEEKYEITGDTCTAPDHHGPSKSRSSRVGLFNNLEICCTENSIVNMVFTRDDIFQLIELCGGMRIDSPDAFSYRRGTKRIILMEESVDCNGQALLPTPEEVKRRKDMHRRYKAVLLSVDWVLDSISKSARIDAQLPVNSAYSLFPVPHSELAAVVSC